ncbi:MAG: sulfotransferase [Brevundimonas sp.]|uniref:sulfotransferase n=1 Tax=Brevundimonas sp. TaxID=1871086 RepID=UPI00391B8EE3
MAFTHPRPLIVCGFGRSGTRMCANLLANSGVVELQGEIPREIAQETLSWLTAARAAAAPTQPERVYSLARSVFRDITPARPMDRPDALWFGHKTPHHERHFDRYEAIFDQPGGLPVYVYCLRNPFHVWRSYRVMPWGGFDRPGGFLKSWLRSVAAWERMRQVAPERVLLFNLDAMIRAPDREVWLGDALFAPLGLSVDTFRKPVETIGNTNSAEAKLGVAPSPAPLRDIKIIARNRQAMAVVRTHFPWIEDEIRPESGVGLFRA